MPLEGLVSLPQYASKALNHRAQPYYLFTRVHLNILIYHTTAAPRYVNKQMHS